MSRQYLLAVHHGWIDAPAARYGAFPFHVSRARDDIAHDAGAVSSNREAFVICFCEALKDFGLRSVREKEMAQCELKTNWQERNIDDQ